MEGERPKKVLKRSNAFARSIAVSFMLYALKGTTIETDYKTSPAPESMSDKVFEDGDDFKERFIEAVKDTIDTIFTVQQRQCNVALMCPWIFAEGLLSKHFQCTDEINAELLDDIRSRHVSITQYSDGYVDLVFKSIVDPDEPC